MATLSVLYPATPGSKFDRTYYADTHSAVVHRAWDGMGLTKLTYTYGEAALGGGAAPYHLIATLTFRDRAALDAAVAGEAAKAVFADIANFTDVAPVAVIGTER